MQLLHKETILLLTVSLLLCGHSFAAAGAKDLEAFPVRNLRIPIELYENGVEKVKLQAEGARVVRADKTELAGVRVEFFTPEGELDGNVYAERCMYHSAIKAVMSQDFVRIEKQGIVITGVGFEWHSSRGTFELSSKGKVEFSRQVDGVAGAVQKSVIRGDFVVFDYNNGSLLFQGNVSAEDMLGKVTADRLGVLFQGTNSVKSVTADGNVKAVANAGSGKCRKSIFIVDESKVIMTGDAMVLSDGASLAGDKITVWLNDGKMTCEPGRLIIPEKKPASLGGLGEDEKPLGRGDGT